MNKEMKNNEVEKMNKISGIFLILVIIKSLFDIALEKTSYYSTKENILSSILLIIVIAMVVAVIFMIYYTIRKNIKSTIEDYKIYKDIRYFRDILPNTCPAIISLMENGNIEFGKDIMATVYSLKLKGYIQLEQDKQIQITKKEITKLYKNEKYLIDNYERIFRKDITAMNEWASFVIEDAKDLGFIGGEKSILTKYFGLLVILGILGGGMISFIWSGLSDENIFPLIIVGILCFIVAKAEKYIEIKFGGKEKNQKGTEFYKKIKGLKNYIKDYSLLPEAEQSQLILWDDYLIYAITFGYEGNLSHEIQKEYKQLKQEYKPNKESN